MRCPKCGAQNPENYRFCSNCGYRLDAESSSGDVHPGAANDVAPMVSANPGGPAASGVSNANLVSAYAEGDTPSDQLTPVTVLDSSSQSDIQYGGAYFGADAYANTVPAGNANGTYDYGRDFNASYADGYGVAQGNSANGNAANGYAVSNGYTAADPNGYGSNPYEDPRDVPETLRKADAVSSPEATESKKGRRKNRKSESSRERHPMRVLGVVVVVLAVLVALGAAGFFGWAYINKQDQEISQLKQQVSDLQAQQGQAASSSDGSGTSSSTSKTASSSTDSSGSGASNSTDSASVSGSGSATQDYSSYASYVGTWTGDLKETDSLWYSKCYGASTHPISIEFQNIQSSGQATVVCNVLYHGHKVSDLSNDAASCDGDSYLSTGALTTSFDPQAGFSFNYTPDGDDTNVEVRAEPDQSSSDNAPKFKVTVKSTFVYGEYVTDTYVISKS